MLNGIAGKDVGNGTTRFDVPGKSPLFTNMTDSVGMSSNQALMSRGAIRPEDQVIAQAMSDRFKREAQNTIQRAANATQMATETAMAQRSTDAGLKLANSVGQRIDGERARQNAESTLSMRNINPAQRQAASETLKILNQRETAREESARVDDRAAATDATTRREQDIRARGQELQAGALRQSTQFNQQLARDKFGLEQAKDGRESAASAMDLETKQQLKAAQQEYLNAGDDPVKQKAAERKLMALGNRQGKAPTFHPGSRIKNVDGSETVTPAYVFDPNTGQAQEVGAQGKSQPPAHDIARLQANPSEIAKFESVYGKGSAAQYLGKK